MTKTEDLIPEKLIPVALAISNQYSRRFTWFRADAKSCAFVGLCKALKHLETVEHPEPLAYIRRIIHQEVEHALRSERRQRKHVMNYRPLDRENEKPNLYGVAELLNDLSDSDRQLVELRMKGLKISEISLLVKRRKANVIADLNRIAQGIMENK